MINDDGRAEFNELWISKETDTRLVKNIKNHCQLHIKFLNDDFR